MLTNALSGKTPSFNRHPLHATESGLLRRNHRRAVSGSKAPNIRRSLAPVDPKTSNSLVATSPVQHVRRRVAEWSDITAEIVQATSSERTEYHYRGPRHLLVLFDQLVRRDGATSIEGLRTSSLRDLTRKLIFVPAGCEFSHWHEARSGGRVVLFYFDPDAIPLAGTGGAGDEPSEPRLFFEDAALLSTTEKLASLLEGPHCGNRDYVEALARVLAHELVRMQQGQSRTKQNSSWRPRVLAAARRHDLYRGASCRPDLARNPCRARRSQRVPFLSGLQAVLWAAASPLPHGQAHRTREDPAGQARIFGDRYRHEGRIRRDELLHRSIPQSDRRYAEHLSPRSSLIARLLAEQVVV